MSMFLGLVFLGLTMPPTVEFLTESPEIQYFIGPSSILRCAHWAWTVPVAIFLSVFILLKDTKWNRTAQRFTNWTMLCVIVAAVALWLQGTFYVRMVQMVH